MKALHFRSHLQLRDMAFPSRKSGEVRIQVKYAGICNTDIEITRGYIPGFDGVPGHEFVGIIEDSDNSNWIGKRATAEINIGCGTCSFCTQGLSRHCPSRGVLGIIRQQGAFAEYVCVPEKNVILIPDNVSDEQAVFIEPFAAALEIQEQIHIRPDDKILLIGDGKLAQVIGRSLEPFANQLDCLGRHHEKLKLLSPVCRKTHHKTIPDSHFHAFDIVIESSGNPSGFETAFKSVKPRGTIILKSTFAENHRWNPAELVVNEIQLLGSRCGKFSDVLAFFKKYPFRPESLIHSLFPIESGLEAFQMAQSKGVLKVVLTFNSDKSRFLPSRKVSN